MGKPTNLGKIVDSVTGQVLMEMFGPPNALSGEDSVAKTLYALSEMLTRGYDLGRHSGLGGDFGYGVEFDNPVLMMHPFCWCEKEDCLWCTPWLADDGKHSEEESKEHRIKQEQEILARFGSPSFKHPHAPHFWHKRTGLKIRWYKWIGRDMEANMELSPEQWTHIFAECWESVPLEIRLKAQLKHDEENTPEALERLERQQQAIFAAMGKLLAEETPCWECSKAGPFGRNKDGSLVGGTFRSGKHGCVTSTLHGDDGACTECGHVNSEEESRQLAERSRLNIQEIRKMWGLSDGITARQ
jgi:hypothetical protein